MTTKLKRPSIIVQAVQPNAGTEQSYQTALWNLLTQAHAELIRLLGVDTLPAVGIARDDNLTVGGMIKLLAKWGRQWVRRFNAMSDEIAEDFIRRNKHATETAMRLKLKKAGFTVAFKPTRASMDAYRAVLAENVGLIRSIGEEYHRDVQTRVWESVKAGGDLYTLSKGLRKTYRITAKRAALIARDQNRKAKAVIEATRRQELGITEAIWQHSHAGKEPRPTHVAMNGKRFALAEGMWDKDEGEWVQPGQLINCRCTSRAIIPGL